MRSVILLRRAPNGVVYGPMDTSAIQIIPEGIMTFPDAGCFWQMIERHKATIGYTAPIAIGGLTRAATIDDNVYSKQSASMDVV